MLPLKVPAPFETGTLIGLIGRKHGFGFQRGRRAIELAANVSYTAARPGQV
jgi:hypothetical protein